MADSTTDCREVAGKTIESLQLIRSINGAQELLIKFTDDTAFTLNIEPTTTRSVRLVRLTEGGTETLRSYDE